MHFLASHPFPSWVDAVVAIFLVLFFSERLWPKTTNLALKWCWAALKVLIAVAIAPLLWVLFKASPNRWFLRVFTFLWPHNDIEKAGKGLYLRRFYLTPRIKGRRRWFLHYIARSDDDRDGHDHPWKFKSRILFSGYLEQVFFPRYQAVDGPAARAEYRPRRQGDVFTNPATHTHKVTLWNKDGEPVPAWTLVERTWGERIWGFWELDPVDPSKDRWIPQSEYGGAGQYKSSWRPST